MSALTTLASSAGHASLQFTLGHGGQTILSRSFATSPVKVFATRSNGVASWVYAATLGGGLVGGDRISMTVDVAEGARALVTTQASTKVYRSARPSTQTVAAAVGRGAFLAMLPDPIVCYAGADFTQTQQYDLHADASLVLVDWVTSGRHASGERWAFNRYHSRIRIARDGEPVLSDAIALEHELDSVHARMGTFDVWLTAVLSGRHVVEAAAGILADVSARKIVRGADVLASASRISDGGLLLRLAGPSVEQVGRAARDFLRSVNPLLGDDPWSRKW